MPSRDGRFNPYQQRHLLITCQHLDGLLAGMEEVLSSASSRRAFPKYISDFTDAQRKTVEDYIARVREHLLRVLASQGLDPGQPDISALHAIRVSLDFLAIDVEELAPKHMRGYGPVTAEAATELQGIISELDGLFTGLQSYLRSISGFSFRERLAPLSGPEEILKALNRLETAINSAGLVEFRTAFSRLLDRMEDRHFEIAVFGRVSSGKSSLLNAILQTDVLPVGVTPITAVPTRLVHGNEAAITVWQAGRGAQRLPISQLAEFATEKLNPGNSKRVTRLVAEVPSPRLAEGIVFVDTPGLGSLATAGAGETLAYLPQCDLGVLLIDAGAIPTADDLRVVRLLHEAGIRSQIVISKADLLSQEQLQEVTDYVRREIGPGVSDGAKIYPISVMPSHHALFDEWFHNVIEPLYAGEQSLRTEAVAAKVAALQDAIEHSLELRLRRRGAAPEEREKQSSLAEDDLRHAAARIEQSRVAVDRITDGFHDLHRSAGEEIASALVRAWNEDRADPRKLLAAEAANFGRRKAKEAYDLLHQLAVDLTETLNAIADRLGSPHRPSDVELASAVQEMPLFEAPLPPQDFKRSKLSWLGASYTKWRAAVEVQAYVSGDLARAYDNYGAVFRTWTWHSLRAIRERFETYADSYRVHLAKSAEGGETQVNREELAAALRLLREGDPSAKPELRSAG